MQIHIPDELKPFVEQEFATGRYATREEVIVQALLGLRDERSEALRGIEQGLSDVVAGRTETLSDAFAGIRKEFRIPEAK